MSIEEFVEVLSIEVKEQDFDKERCELVARELHGLFTTEELQSVQTKNIAMKRILRMAICLRDIGTPSPATYRPVAKAQLRYTPVAKGASTLTDDDLRHLQRQAWHATQEMGSGLMSKEDVASEIVLYVLAHEPTELVKFIKLRKAVSPTLKQIANKKVFEPLAREWMRERQALGHELVTEETMLTWLRSWKHDAEWRGRNPKKTEFLDSSWDKLGKRRREFIEAKIEGHDLGDYALANGMELSRSGHDAAGRGLWQLIVFWELSQVSSVELYDGASYRG